MIGIFFGNRSIIIPVSNACNISSILLYSNVKPPLAWIPGTIPISSNPLKYDAFLIILLISFYRFYPLFFRKRSLKTFIVLIFLNFFTIILYLFFLINIRAFFLLEFNIFVNLLVLTIILIPGILLLFLFVNYLINILSVREYLNSTYYTCWILIATIGMSIFMIFYTIIIVIILDLMLISFLIHYQLRFGQKLEKIKETRFKHLNKFNSYFFTAALSCFYFFVFSLWFNIILTIFISLLLISVQIYILAKRGVFFSKSLSVKMNIITLLYFSLITFYYILLLTLNTIFVLIVPLSDMPYPLFNSIELDLMILSSE